MTRIFAGTGVDGWNLWGGLAAADTAVVHARSAAAAPAQPGPWQSGMMEAG